MAVLKHILFDAQELDACDSIDFVRARPHYAPHAARKHIERITVTTSQILKQAEHEQRLPLEFANCIAEQQLGATPQGEEACHGTT